MIQRLYAQHECLIRLLETLGFVITYEEGVMMIQRASKVSNNAVIDTSSLAGSETTLSPPPLKGQPEDYSELFLLQRSDSAKPEEEDKRYYEFIKTLNRFSLETLVRLCQSACGTCNTQHANGRRKFALIGTSHFASRLRRARRLLISHSRKVILRFSCPQKN